MGLLLVPSGHALPHSCEGPAPLLLHRQDVGQAHLASGPSTPQVQPKQLLHSGGPGEKATSPSTSDRCPHPALSGTAGRRTWWLAFRVCTGHTLLGASGGLAQDSVLPSSTGSEVVGDTKGEVPATQDGGLGCRGGTTGQPKPCAHPVAGSEAGGGTPATHPAASMWHGGGGRRPQSRPQASPSITGWRQLLLDRHTAPGPSSTWGPLRGQAPHLLGHPWGSLPSWASAWSS